ncbi:Crp/Fnr family transcriptional regulator [Halpernia frigidisoli]|uniref:cAMP-binding domain of CRP or a regulatory subunit of cAMP-dependent protein kinases n=1 Tax=Halpernia frigidisoli TaxID=1125876 RepID=A0A1I3EDK8_9FLAO|nr:Crp/Fnr family transcriptional regulator [Halpernia frigidisoli]SFH97060.1 cAMP-binding domain of CRP or a regulatory subunit of cAMP-dependent protein kinases [Halpernia frigidisoli]
MCKLILNNYFHSLFPIQKEIVEKITESFCGFTLNKNTILINRETISIKTYFLQKGYVRSYILNENNEEVTTNIYSAPCFVNDFLSFFKKQPTKEIYQTITDCYFWETDLENVQSNFHNIAEFREFSRLLFVINYSKLNDRLIEMVSQKAETRYLNLLNHQSHIFQQVSLKIIASYLGVTDSTLSRIRKEISKI